MLMLLFLLAEQPEDVITLKLDWRRRRGVLDEDVDVVVVVVVVVVAL